ncbi:acyl-CoA-like ligand-binding transcription factor [Kutzneria chonburiensis]|uniref:TetR family transcriptional regulator n=1 Tax=Kutzneria chonburiensis TaxID=1483604 RepID=A0ABV6MPS6_9PSEU|nr:TetR family transcriptional regulator [Kutzneria chonburiensis]
MTGLRERKKRETRLALSRATIALIVARGWDEVSVEDIAAAANVSERTFRNYFTSKAEAVAASHLERALVVADELRSQPADEPFWPAVLAAVRSSLAGAPANTQTAAGPDSDSAGAGSAAGPGSGAGRGSELAGVGSAAGPGSELAGAPSLPRDAAYMERVKLVLTHPSLHAELLRADDIAKDELAVAIAERLGLDRDGDLFPQLAASVVAAGIATAMRFWMLTDPTGSVLDVIDRVFAEIGRGLPAPEGES